MRRPGLGYIPDPPKREGEKPDKLFVLAARPLPKVDLRELVVKVLNQGGLGACVLFTIMQQIRMAHVAQGVKEPALPSILFPYYFCRAAMHTTSIDSGTHLRTGYRILNKFGFCPETFWSYDDDDTGSSDDKFRRMPATLAFQKAYDNRSPAIYRRILGEGDELVEMLKAALVSGRPVGFGVDVDEAFVEGKFDIDRPVPAPLVSAGGHAMTMVGFDADDNFLVLNSWGTSFGRDGYCWLSRNYILQSRDRWVVDHAPVEGET